MSDFTMVLKQNGATVASTSTTPTFQVRDGICEAQGFLTANAAGTVTTEVKVTPTGLPAPLNTGHLCEGSFVYNDAGTAVYEGSARFDGTDIKFRAHNTGNALGVTPSYAVASTDTLSFTITYPVA